MDLQKISDRIMEFYAWVGTQTGLENWQMVAIALAVLFGLLILLHYQRRKRIRKIHVISRSDRSDIIGINLANNAKSGRENKFANKFSVDEQNTWGQSTKDWRKLREKIMYLQRDISKYERTEKHLKEQILELQAKNEELQAVLDNRVQGEELIMSNLATKSNSEGSDTVETATITQVNQESEKIQAEEKTNSAKTKIIENLEQSNSSERDENIPLDIKELKAIADLVKRLQTRSQQRQGE